MVFGGLFSTNRMPRRHHPPGNAWGIGTAIQELQFGLLSAARKYGFSFSDLQLMGQLYKSLQVFPVQPGGIAVEPSAFPLVPAGRLALGLIAGSCLAGDRSSAVMSRTNPAALSSRIRMPIRGLIALAYLADGDVGRAAARLALLKESSSVEALAAQSQRVYAEGGSIDEPRRFPSWPFPCSRKT